MIEKILESREDAQVTGQAVCLNRTRREIFKYTIINSFTAVMILNHLLSSHPYVFPVQHIVYSLPGLVPKCI